jgi:UDP-N-acetyl-2-amino-2-deoxyglucuronate dehydrogenase
MMKNFALIGAAGYIAPRHMKAIKDTGNKLVAAVDPFDSVGILDSFFYDVAYFKEFERFDRHIEKLRRIDKGKQVDYVSICSPNYLHDAHIRFALRVGATPLCEKPLVLNPWNLDALQELEQEYDNKIQTILQVRCHPSILELKKKIDNAESDKIYDIDLTYITSRGKWYDYSWKGDNAKSGGVAINIGIHFFDMLMWIFGDVKHQEVHIAEKRKTGGYIELENARVRWFLSLDRNDLPKQAVKEDKPTYRSIQIEGEEVEFSGGFTDLHTVVYEKTLEGKGYGIEDVRPVINLLYDIRHMEPSGVNKIRSHPLLIKSIK